MISLLVVGQVWSWIDQIGPWPLYEGFFETAYLWETRAMKTCLLFYMKVSINCLNTFILSCGPSLVMDRPDRPVAVYMKVSISY